MFRSTYAILSLLAMIVALVWFVGNLIDRPLDPDFAKFQATDNPPADKDNAYFALLGLEAPVAEDAHAYGLKLYTQEKTERENTVATFDDLRDAIINEVEDIKPDSSDVSIKQPDPVLPHMIDRKKENIDCWTMSAHEYKKTQESATNPIPCMSQQEVSRYVQEVIPLLERYTAILSYPRLYEHYSTYFIKGQTLISLNDYYTARNVLWAKNGEGDKAMQHWLANMNFINRALIDKQTTVFKSIIFIVTTHNLNGLEAIIEADPSLAVKYEDPIIAALKDPVTPNLESILIGNFLAEYDMTIGFLNSISGFKMRLAYKKNATTNEFVSYYRDKINASKKPPVQLDQTIANINEKYLYPPQDFLYYADLAAYNFTGKLTIRGSLIGHELLLVFPWRQKAMRDILSLRIKALAENIKPQDMPAFLQNSKTDYYDAYSGGPYNWDAAGQTIYFSTLRKYSDREEVAYP